MNFQGIKSSGKKYNWMISSFFVHGILTFILTGELIAVFAAVIISLDHS